MARRSSLLFIASFASNNYYLCNTMNLYLGLILALFPILGMAASCSNPTGLASWSATYGATVSSDIIISTAILVDVPGITAQGITLNQGGSLYFDVTKSITLAANFILINGGAGLYIGSEACPYSQKATITLKGNAVSSSMFGANFIGVSAGGTLELHGAKGLGLAWTKLNSTANAGATFIQVASPLSGLQTGDKLVVTTTDYSPTQSEVVTVTAINGNTISFVPALQWSHFGAITSGVDQRAEVGLLTRNILIQGSNQGNYFGGHLMIARGFSQAHIEGVEFSNMGQDQIARYPIHFHLCGDVPSGTYVKYNSIHDSNFRCVTIHSTNGVLVQGNVAYKNYGHCYFLEDGVEVNNVLTGNLAVSTQPKNFGQRIGSDLPNTGLSSYWITNPQNTIEFNVAAGSYTAGFWIITRLGARGVSACIPQYQNLPYTISNLQLTSFRGNVAHSCDFGLGIESTNWDSGDVPAQTCDTPVANWEPKFANGTIAWTTFRDFTAHHIRDRGLWARMPNIVLDGGRFSDNFESVEYATSGDHPPYPSQQIVQNSIIIGFSDNKGNQAPDTFFQRWDTTIQHSVPAFTDPMNGMKIYDGAQGIMNTVFINFPSIAGRNLDAPIGARSADQAQVATTNYVQNLQFINTFFRFRVIDDVMDGGITANFRDKDGSVTGYTGSTALRNFPYYNTPQCQAGAGFMLSCPHRYAQLWVLDMTANGNNNYMYITRGHTDTNHAAYTLGFKGFIAGPLYRYQPIVSIGNNYLIKFQAHVPSSLALQLNNAEVGDSVGLAVCYPLGTIITTVQRGFSNYNGNPWPMGLPQSFITNIPAVGSVGTSSDTYYFDSSRGILFVRLQQRNARSDYGNFCPTQGCDFVWINAQFTGPTGATARDCTNDAYASGLLNAPATWLTSTLQATTSTATNILTSLVGSVSTVTPPSMAATSRPTSAPTSPPDSSSGDAPTSTSAPTTTTTSAPTTTTTTTSAPTTTTAPVDSTCSVTCPSGMGCCGGACYSADRYQCNAGGKLCELGYSSCGSMCYPPSVFTCIGGFLQHI